MKKKSKKLNNIQSKIIPEERRITSGQYLGLFSCHLNSRQNLMDHSRLQMGILYNNIKYQHFHFKPLHYQEGSFDEKLFGPCHLFVDGFWVLKSKIVLQNTTAQSIFTVTSTVKKIYNPKLPANLWSQSFPQLFFSIVYSECIQEKIRNLKSQANISSYHHNETIILTRMKHKFY